jgi:hypothetical protein
MEDETSNPFSMIDKPDELASLIADFATVATPEPSVGGGSLR